MPSLGRRNPSQSMSLLMAKYARPAARRVVAEPPRKVARIPVPVPEVRSRALPRIALITAIVLLAAWFAMPEAVRDQLVPGLRGPRAQLVKFLTEYRAAWRPEDKAAVVGRVEQARRQMRSPLRWVLTQPAHPYVAEAIELAGAVRAEWALPELKALRKVRTLRGSVLVAMDKIRPLSDEDLAQLLAEQDGKLLLVALGIGHAREVPPLVPMLRLLRHKDAEVRTAALAALPARLPEEVVPLLLDLAGDSDDSVAVMGLQALARAPLGANVERLLAELLGRNDVPVVHAALTALAARSEALSPTTSARVWQVILLPGRERRTLARAFLCLERSKSVDPAQARRIAGELDGFGRYFVARQLLSVGETDGAGLLFELISEGTGNGADASVRFAARALLATLTGTTAAAGEAVWRRWFEEHPLSGTRELPPPLLDF